MPALTLERIMDQSGRRSAFPISTGGLLGRLLTAPVTPRHASATTDSEVVKVVGHKLEVNLNEMVPDHMYHVTLRGKRLVIVKDAKGVGHLYEFKG